MSLGCAAGEPGPGGEGRECAAASARFYWSESSRSSLFAQRPNDFSPLLGLLIRSCEGRVWAEQINKDHACTHPTTKQPKFLLIHKRRKKKKQRNLNGDQVNLHLDAAELHHTIFYLPIRFDSCYTPTLTYKSISELQFSGIRYCVQAESTAS